MKFYLYRLKWWLAQWIDFESPIHVDIEVTSACNLRCPICHQTDTPRVYDLGKMKTETAMDRLIEARKLGALSVKFNWRGEALIHSGIWELLQKALDLGFVDVLINTNLSVQMTDEQIQLLAKLPTVKVSMDSVTNYAVARKGGDRDLVFDNIARLMRYRRRLEINRHQSSVTEPFHLFRAAFQEFLGDANRRVNPDLFPLAGAQNMMQRILLSNHVAQERNHNSGMFKSATAGKERVYCKMPSRRLLISGTTGHIYPCCVPYAEHEDLRVGAKNTSLREAWHSPRRRALVADLKAGHLPNKACQACTSSDAWRVPGWRALLKRMVGVRAW